MNMHSPSLRTGSFETLMALLLVVMTTGCGSLLQRTANLEDDELYLDRGEEFITDAEYLAYAYEQAGYDVEGGEYGPRDSRGGDAFQSSFGYVPQSLRGRSMLRGYMTPYGAAGFGPNPYDPWGSSFYGGYSAYNPGFYDPYNPYGSPMGNLGWGSSAWGVNPYMGGSFGNVWGNSWGMNPYGNSPYGFNSYNPYNPYGAGGWYGGGNNWGNAWGGGDVFDVNTVVVAPRTPIWTSSAINSNGGGGRLLTNKVDEVDAESGKPAAPLTIWRGIDAVESKAASRATRQARTAPTSPAYPNPARTTSESNGRSSYGSGNNSGRSSYGTSNSSRTTTRSSSTRNSSSRNSSWSGSSSGSSRSSGSRPSTRPSSGRSSGSSSGRSSGSSRGGRGGFPSP